MSLHVDIQPIECIHQIWPAEEQLCVSCITVHTQPEAFVAKINIAGFWCTVLPSFWNNRSLFWAAQQEKQFKETLTLECSQRMRLLHLSPSLQQLMRRWVGFVGADTPLCAALETNPVAHCVLFSFQSLWVYQPGKRKAVACNTIIFDWGIWYFTVCFLQCVWLKKDNVFDSNFKRHNKRRNER